MKKFQLKKDNQIFSRFEFKYIINKNLSKVIQQEVKNFTTNDDFTKKKNKYLVRSLYFDNNIFTNFKEKIDGIKNRHKFRIRTYSINKNELVPMYLEMKGRDNQRTFKNRTKIEIDDLKSFCGNKDLFHLKKKYLDNKLINQFIFDFYRKKILPKVIIDYNRKALLSKNGLYFRLTFDSDIKACSSQDIFEKNHNWKECISGNDILEVKFDLNIPPWFHRIIQNYQLKRISVSKFVLGMESTNLAQDYEGI
tara:strand:+ start:2105 stop:2857 length:753 start_codon:yes stop_codon:yes gene_type:complete